MVWHIDPVAVTAGEPTDYVAVLRKWSYATGVGDMWDNVNSVFGPAVTIANARIEMSELTATHGGMLVGSTIQDLTSTYTGHVIEIIQAKITNELLLQFTSTNPKIFFCRNGIKQSVSQNVSPVAVVEVPETRTWIVNDDGRVSKSLIVSVLESGTFSMDFSRILEDNETSFSSVDSAADITPNALSISNVRLSGDKMKVYLDVAAAAWTASTTYNIRCVGTATDGNKYSGDGALKTRA